MRNFTNAYDFGSAMHDLCRAHAIDPKKSKELLHNLVDFDEAQIYTTFESCLISARQSEVDAIDLTNIVLSLARRNPPDEERGSVIVKEEPSEVGYGLKLIIEINGTAEYVVKESLKIKKAFQDRYKSK